MERKSWKNWVWKGCRKCGCMDPAQFAKKMRARSGLQPLCRSCHKLAMRKNAATHRRSFVLRQYNLTPEAYDALLAKQGGVCAMCHQPPTGRRLSVDHDHSCCPGKKSCGKCVRGLLHFSCNSLLGIAGDSVGRLSDAIQYLSNVATMQSV